MSYSIKQLANLAGISSRTLRYYDSIKLLSPECYSEKGYRLYKKKQLLLLQQILFFRELGFKLRDIKMILNSDEFDQLEALTIHKGSILDKISQLKKIIESIDQTAAHLQGKIKMKENDLYLAFKHPQQIENAAYLKTKLGGGQAEKLIHLRNKILKKKKIIDWVEIQQQTQQFSHEFKLAIENNLQPGNSKVQDLVKRYYANRIKPYSTFSGDELVAFIEAEISHPDFKKQFDDIHPNFSDYFFQSVKIFASRNL